MSTAPGKWAAFPEPHCQHYSKSVDESTDTFIARMRFHQSWYRYQRELEPGPNPNAKGALYGNMLNADDAVAGKNFLYPYIFEMAKERFPPATGKKVIGRLYNNLLGSQPMCFNLFGPLKAQPAVLGTALMRLLKGFPPDATVTRVFFEHAPAPKQNFLNDLSSFDCFVEYQRPKGVRGFIGIETKLTEPFSQEHCPIHVGYSRWHGDHNKSWKPEVLEQFSTPSYNQLWRNHLLAYAMLNQPRPEYAEGFCAVVYPMGDTHCSEAIREYRKVLTMVGEATLLEWTLEEIVAKWKSAFQERTEICWLSEFQKRYLDLSGSESAWQAFKRSIP